MNQFVDTLVEFDADCVRQNDRCEVGRDNFIFLDDGLGACGGRLPAEEARACGGNSRRHSRRKGAALSHELPAHGRCVNKIFLDIPAAAASVPQAAPEMRLGRLQHHAVRLP